MAIFIVENSGKVGYGIKRYICKAMEDIPVEVNGEEIAPGSKIYVTDEKKTYMLNTAGQWVEITEGSGGGASALSDLTDVNLNKLADGEYLVYDAESGMWKNGTGKDIYTELQGVLSAGETTITLTSDFITTNSVIEDFVDDAFDGIEYVSREVENGSITYTFPKQSSNMPVMARVWIKGVGTVGVAIEDDEISLNSTWSSTKIAQELGKKLSGTLTAGSTSITFTDASITESALYDFYTDTWGVNPTAVTIITGQLTLTFEEQTSDVSVKVVIR